MNTLHRILRLLTAAALAACLALPGAGSVLANGLGDLYVAVPAGVDEVYLKGGDVVTTVPLSPAPDRLAFTTDGRTLYAGDGGRRLYKIDIESISLAETITLPETGAAIAHPRGDVLLVALPGSATLGALLDGDDTIEDGPALPGAVDLLAADRREARAIAAQRGKAWAAIIEPASFRVREVGVGGEVVGLAMGRDEGVAYVATTNPDRVVAVDLATAKVAWTAPLDAAPVSVTAIAGAAVVAAGDGLTRAADGKAAAWAPLPAAATAVATSDEGQFVYAALADRVLAISVKQPTKTPAAAVELEGAGPAALAPVPRASSLVKDGATSPGSGGGETTGEAGVGAVPTPATGPATDTVGGPVVTIGGRDVTGILPVVAVVVVVGLVGSRWLIRRLTGAA